jgi:hypothetical protein
MDSKLKQISNLPLIKRFVLNIINKTPLLKKIKKREIINTDFIPKPSEKIISKTFKKPLISERTKPPLMQISKQPVQGEYGKLTPIIQDVSISSIECPGPGKNINIIRAGQKQFTKIILSPHEINDLLEDFSQKANIPLIEGIFRAAVDDLIINAIISDSIGSRFIIKKQTPYSILER